MNHLFATVRTLAVFLVLTAVAAAADDALAEKTPNWHETAFFGLHFDLHPNVQDTELGRETTAEHIRAMLEKVRPDFVQYDCKGHPGYTGYPTKVGAPSPGIVNDALKIWREVTREMGIPLSIHYSGIWDSRAIEEHPDWARVDARGNRHPHYASLLSPYPTERMIPQLLEVVREYDIDGMWIDGDSWAALPDWSPACQAEFTRRTGISEIPQKAGDPHWEEWLAFHRSLFKEYVIRYIAAVKAVKPSCLVTSNWSFTVRMPEALDVPLDYISGDYDPSFGSERAMAEARFIASRGVPWDLMAWSFLKTGDQPWTFKTAAHMSQELATVMAQGGAVFIYDTPQRSGRLNAWHMDILAEVAQFCRERQPWCHRTKTLPQIAVLHSETTWYTRNDPLFNFSGANQPMEGAMFALLESGWSVDLLNEASLAECADAYPLIVIPEVTRLPESFRQAMTGYVEQGGRLLISGSEAVDLFGGLAGLIPADTAPPAMNWLPVEGRAVAVQGTFRPVTPGSDVTVLAHTLYEREPDLNRREAVPAALLRRVGSGVVAVIPGPVFRAYFQSRYPDLRRFIAGVIAAMEPSGLAQVDGPWWIEMAARRRDNTLLIQLVNRSVGGYLSPLRHIVESVPDPGPFTVRVPLPGKPTSCRIEPGARTVDWSWADGSLTARLPGLSIYDILVIEP